MMDDAIQRMQQIARREGIQLTPRDAEPSTRGWQHPDPLGARIQHALDVIEHDAPEEFKPNALPPLDSRVGEWIEDHKRRMRDKAAGRKTENPPKARLVMFGKTGSGKTSQGWHIIGRLSVFAAELDPGYRWRWVTHREFAAETRDFTDDHAETAIDKYKRASLLLWDDFGAYSPTPFARECTSRLLDYRYIHGLPTVITTNLVFRRTTSVLKEQEDKKIVIPVIADMVDARDLSRLMDCAYVNLGKIDHREARVQVLR